MLDSLLKIIPLRKNKKMKSILHIGADKCGSSSLQKFLTINPELSTRRGSLKYACIKDNHNKIFLGKEIKYLTSLGMIIGSHSESHTVLSRLSYEKQFKEIKGSKTF